MSHSTHRIRRQTWLVRASSQVDAMRVRSELSNAWSDASTGEFEQACDDAAPNDVVLRIPQLTLHVRLANVNDLATKLPALISEQLAEQVREVRERALRGESTAGEIVLESSVTTQSFENLVHYLRTGSLPWTVSGRAPNEILDELRAAIGANLKSVVRQVSNHNSEASWFRLLQLLDNNHDELISVLASETRQSWSRALASSFGDLSTGAHLSVYASLRVGAAIITAIVDGPELLPDRVAASVHALNAIDQSRLREWAKSLPDSADDNTLTALKRAIIDHPIGKYDAIAHADEKHVEQNSPFSAVDQTETGQTNTQAILRQSVANAGLILLHPFIPAFLQRVGLNIDGVISIDALPRAAALLHHLATGRIEIYEFELGFIKVLLGITPETALPVTTGLLTAQDIEESDALIGAMIGHWTAIGKTSIAGLRSTFLSRIGLLALEDLGWTLHVESSSIDMLLDRLPWGFGIIRLPWMQRTLYTQWTH